MSKKPEVLFLLHLPPPVHGSSIVGMNIRDSKMINGHYEGRYLNLLASRSVAETGRLTIRKMLGFVSIFFKVAGTLIKSRPRLCYLAVSSTGAAMFKDLLLVMLLRLFRVRIVFHMHNKGVETYRKKPIHAFAYKLLFRKVTVILLSDLLYKDIHHFVSRDKIFICPNGIADPVPPGILPEQKKSLDERPFNILFLSNLIESKGPYVLLEAMAILKSRGIRFAGHFIGGEGDVSATEFRQRITHLGLDASVTYHGKKYGEEKHVAFMDADIFAFPTYYPDECFPLVVLEAMSYALPVVSTFEGGVPDIVDDGTTGFIVPQQDVIQLADRLGQLAANELLRKSMGQAARSKYERLYTLPVFESTLVSILDKVMEKD